MVECKMDEFWIARVQFWPDDITHILVIQIYYVWQDGAIDFVTFGDEAPIRSNQCAHFELLEKIEVDKYE